MVGYEDFASACIRFSRRKLSVFFGHEEASVIQVHSDIIKDGHYG